MEVATAESERWPDLQDDPDGLPVAVKQGW